MEIYHSRIRNYRDLNKLKAEDIEATISVILNQSSAVKGMFKYTISCQVYVGLTNFVEIFGKFF